MKTKHRSHDHNGALFELRGNWSEIALESLTAPNYTGKKESITIKNMQYHEVAHYSTVQLVSFGSPFEQRYKTTHTPFIWADSFFQTWLFFVVVGFVFGTRPNFSLQLEKLVVILKGTLIYIGEYCLNRCSWIVIFQGAKKHEIIKGNENHHWSERFRFHMYFSKPQIICTLCICASINSSVWGSKKGWIQGFWSCWSRVPCLLPVTETDVHILPTFDA